MCFGAKRIVSFVLSVVLLLSFPVFSQQELSSEEQEQSVSWKLDEQILRLVLLEANLKEKDEQLKNVEGQLATLETDYQQISETCQILSNNLEQSQKESNIWKNCFIVSGTVAVISTISAIIIGVNKK